jgi:hypothetical protein
MVRTIPIVEKAEREVRDAERLRAELHAELGVFNVALDPAAVAGAIREFASLIAAITTCILAIRKLLELIADKVRRGVDTTQEEGRLQALMKDLERLREEVRRAKHKHKKDHR